MNSEVKTPKTNSKTEKIEKISSINEKKEELWRKVSEHPELEDISKLKQKLEKSKEMRKNTSKRIEDMKKNYDTLKVSIQNFVREQTSSFHKMNYPKRNKGKKNQKNI